VFTELQDKFFSLIYLVYLFIHLVTHITLDMSTAVYILYITTQLVIYGHPPNII